MNSLNYAVPVVHIILSFKGVSVEGGEPHPEGSWYISGEVFFWTHCGTHVEFPFHHRKDGMQAQDYPIDHLIQSDIMNCRVSASREEEESLLGPVFAAGLERGFFSETDGMLERKEYQPAMDPAARGAKIQGWKEAVERCLYKEQEKDLGQ